MGQIITFYSYKGGVGRTFVLANVASQLSLWGYRVLVVDWDLEAPGMHHYFGRYLSPAIASRALCDRQGLIEYIERWQADRSTDWNSFVQKVQLPDASNAIDIIFAGEQTADYGARARGVDWDALYRQHDLGTHLDRIGEAWREAYDFTFIDSRTGLSDTAGICTVQLPDILALVLTASYQSVMGTAWVGARALAADSSSSGRGLAFQVPIISRFAEKEETKLADEWRKRIAEELADLFKAWRPKEIRAEQLIEFLKLPHVARWTYGEEVPVLEETRERSQSIVTNTELISYHVQTLAALFAHQMTGIQSLISERSSYVNRAAQRAVSLRSDAGAPEDLVKLLGELQSKASEAAALGDHSTAISFWNDILAKAESTLGPESPAVLSALRNLSQSLQAMGRASEAEPFLRRALALGEKTLGAESPEIWRDLSNLANVLQDSGRRSEAEQLARRALNIAERNFGGDHPNTKLARENLESLSKKDFFISYNKADRTWAEWIAWQLEESGKYSVVIQAWDFGPGGKFVLEMARWIKKCERVIAVLSPDYLTSVFSEPEWAAYFANDSTGEKGLIVPVRVRECELRGLLASIAYIDLVGKEEATAKAALLNGVKSGRRKPEAAPQFPGRLPRVPASKPHFPGALPEIWNIPHNRNPNFAGPGDRLAELRAAFHSERPAALAQALVGLGGVGKTQLAVEYAYRYAGDYTLVWWLRSEQPATLARDYAALAAQLNLPEKDAPEQHAIIAAVRDALRHRRDWLLVFDNAITPEEIRGYLPGASGHVLITSRHAGWGGVAQRGEVKEWPPEVAVEFLLNRTGQTDTAAGMEVARELGYLPLALEQASAYIESAGKTLAEYLTMVRHHQLRLLDRGTPGSDYPETVATTWEISFREVEKESPSGAALLHLSAFFAPDDIPRDMITAGAEHLPAPLRAMVSDALAFDDAVSAVRRFSLFETSGEASLSVNRLVQAVVRERLGESGREQWAEVAVKVVNAAFPEESEDVRTWKKCDRLLPHAIAASDFAELQGVGLEATAQLINKMGEYAWGRAEYPNAKTAFERSLMIDEKIFGPDDPRVAIRVNNLGRVLETFGDLIGAKAAYERALQIDEKAFGPDHPRVAIHVNNLSAVLNALGDLSGAKAAVERALRIHEKAYGADHPNVATSMNNLGGVLKALGDLPGARAAFERALMIDQKALGVDHPNVATSINNLGGVLKALGDLTGAKAAFEHALMIDEKVLGADHPNAARDVSNLGGVLKTLGNLPEAKAAYERALAILNKVLGEDHPMSQLVRENLASLSQ